MVPFGAFVLLVWRASLSIPSIRLRISLLKRWFSLVSVWCSCSKRFNPLMQYMASPEALQNIVFWTMGSLAKANWINISIVLPRASYHASTHDAWVLAFNGFKIRRWKGLWSRCWCWKLARKSICFHFLITAVAVSFVGTIGFIGIVGPHIARMLVGEDQRYFASICMCGMAILSLASIASKMLRSGGDVPNRYCDSNHRRTFLLLVGIN